MTSAVDHYEVWRDYTDIVQRWATPTTNTVTINNLNRGSVSRFYVVAFDAAGNRSLQSGTITVITLPGDLEPPGPVVLLTASEITDTSVRLSWLGAMWGEVDLFRLYRGLPGGPLVQVGTTTAFTAPCAPSSSPGSPRRPSTCSGSARSTRLATRLESRG